MNHFDSKAGGWDDPSRLRRAHDFAEIIREELGPQTGLSAMEYGCGTGAVGLELRDMFASLLLVDSSAAMIKQVNYKLEEIGDPNLRALKWDLSRNPLEGMSFDLVFATLAFHHIKNVEGLLTNIRSLVPLGGRLIVLDLDSDGGFWHQRQTEFEGHDGFDRQELTKWCAAAQFEVKSVRTVYHHKRTVGSETREIPVFLLDAVAV